MNHLLWKIVHNKASLTLINAIRLVLSIVCQDVCLTMSVCLVQKHMQERHGDTGKLMEKSTRTTYSNEFHDPDRDLHLYAVG